MVKVDLYNKSGQKLTEVNVRTQEEFIDGVQWGGSIFLWDSKKEQYRESEIVPAIFEKKTR